MKTMNMKKEMMKVRHMAGVFATLSAFAFGAVALHLALFAPKLMSVAL